MLKFQTFQTEHSKWFGLVSCWVFRIKKEYFARNSLEKFQWIVLGIVKWSRKSGLKEIQEEHSEIDLNKGRNRS
jgi:hypothetical protein